MKRLALALVLLAPLALAQEKKDEKDDKKSEPTKLPLNPLAGAKEGDWAVLACVMRAPDVSRRTLQRWKIEKVTESEVQVSQAMGVDESSPKTTVALPAKDAPTLESYFQIEKASEVALSDEKKTVGVREFACKKVTFVTPSGARTLHSTAWLSTDVKGSGLVALRIETEADGKKITLDFEVAGFGSKDKTDFGKTAAELAKALGGDEKK